MNRSDVLLIVGVALILFGVFVKRIAPTLAGRRWLFLVAGIGFIAVSAWFGMPDMIAGFRDGYSAGRK